MSNPVMPASKLPAIGPPPAPLEPLVIVRKASPVAAAMPFIIAFWAHALPITVIAVAATLVESLPLKDVDNITITLAAVALGYLMFR